MNSGAIEAISAHVTALSLGTSTPGVAQDISSGQVADGLAGAAGLGEALASIAGRGNPALAALVGTYQLESKLSKIATDATQNGIVNKSDVTNATAALAGTIGGIALAITAAAATTAALPVVLGAALVVTAAALTVQAQKEALAGETWETPEIKAMNDAAKKFLDEAGAAGKAVTKALLDPKFWDEFAAHGEALFEPLLDPLNEAGHWLGQNLPTPQQIKNAVKSATDAAKSYVIPPRRDPLTFDLDGDGLETTAIAATNPILFDHDGDGVKNGTGWVKPDDGFLVRDVNGNGSIDNGRELFGDSTILTSGARAGQNALDGFDALSDLDSIANGGNADGKISNLDTQFSNLRIWRDLNQDGISQMGDSVTGVGRELFTLTELGIASINIAKTSNSQTLANGSGRVAVQQRGTHRRTPCGCNQIADIGSYTKTDGSQAAVGEVTGNLADINLASDTFHRSFTNVLDTTSVATLPNMQACTGMFLSSGSGRVRDLREAANDNNWRIESW